MKRFKRIVEYDNDAFTDDSLGKYANSYLEAFFIPFWWLIKNISLTIGSLFVMLFYPLWVFSVWLYNNHKRHIYYVEVKQSKKRG